MGSKFSDNDLIGIPYKIIVGPRDLKNNEVEIEYRKTGKKLKLSPDESYNFITNKNKMLTQDKWGTENFGISTVLGSWSDHYKSWQNIKFAPILIVKYENLIKDTKNSFITIINFLNKLMEIQFNEKKILMILKNNPIIGLQRKIE